ncbi:MAG: STAS domain-containing protein [Sphingomonadaceae bacterium]|nr:STAS domain-containing protein [Sphingomonadaceae bacterium]
MSEGGAPMVFQPQGKIDETTWAAFAEALTAAVERAKTERRDLRIDFSDVPYMSSRGLRALTLARKGADGVEIVLAGANAKLREVFAISRYDKIFRVEDG